MRRHHFLENLLRRFPQQEFHFHRHIYRAFFLCRSLRYQTFPHFRTKFPSAFRRHHSVLRLPSHLHTAFGF